MKNTKGQEEGKERERLTNLTAQLKTVCAGDV